jgi:DNA-binding FrmR family transcriptional regulator
MLSKLIIKDNFMLPEYNSRVITGIKKSKGQLEHVLQMIEQDKYCLDIAQQINAAIGLLQQSSGLILESHLLSCGAHKLVSKNQIEKKKFAQELVRVFAVTKRKG